LLCLLVGDGRFPCGAGNLAGGGACPTPGPSPRSCASWSRRASCCRQRSSSADRDRIAQPCFDGQALGPASKAVSEPFELWS
jgi:hypothetical protein